MLYRSLRLLHHEVLRDINPEGVVLYLSLLEHARTARIRDSALYHHPAG